MITISLKNVGKFLTGRSLAKDLVQKNQKAILASGQVAFDCTGIESMTQSFISELLVQLIHLGVQLENVELVEVSQSEFSNRFVREKQRVKNLVLA